MCVATGALRSAIDVLIDTLYADMSCTNHNLVFHADGQGKAASLVTSNGSPVH